VTEVGLLSSTLASVLRDLSESSGTGCLVVRDEVGDESEVYLREGKVYAVAVPGRRATLGARLMSSGALSPDALADALEIQRNELQGWRLGELLVHLGYVDRDVVEAFVVEQLKDSVTELLERPVAGWKFRKGRKTRQDVAPPTAIGDLLDEVSARHAAWQRVVDLTGGAEGVPSLSTGAPGSDDVILGPNDWALLCKVDGVRTIAALAADCGFTLFEAGSVIVHLLEAGLVEVPLDDDVEDDPDDAVAGKVAGEVAGEVAGDPPGPTATQPTPTDERDAAEQDGADPGDDARR
jgi:hypothetical protein